MEEEVGEGPTGDVLEEEVVELLPVGFHRDVAAEAGDDTRAVLQISQNQLLMLQMRGGCGGGRFHSEKRPVDYGGEADGGEGASADDGASDPLHCICCVGVRIVSRVVGLDWIGLGSYLERDLYWQAAKVNGRSGRVGSIGIFLGSGRVSSRGGSRSGPLGAPAG